MLFLTPPSGEQWGQCGDQATGRARGAILAAKKRMMREGKLLLNVRGKGYQIAQPGEHAPEAQRLQGAARRDYIRAFQTVVNAHLELMTPEERNRTILEQVRIAMKFGMDRRISRAKTLPLGREQVKIPTGAQIVALMTRKDSKKS